MPSWFRSWLSGLEDWLPAVLPVEEVPEVEEVDGDEVDEVEELEELSALRSASTLVSAAWDALTLFEARDLSRAARSFASVSVAELPVAEVPVALPVLEAWVAVVAAVELAALALVASASSLKSEVLLMVREEMGERLTGVPFKEIWCCVPLLHVSAQPWKT